MNIQIYHVDAFTSRLFTGNPASVCLLPEWLPDETLSAIARENNLTATAFLVAEQDGYTIRWMTPEYELEICGHGTLSAGHVILNYLEPQKNAVKLYSRMGELKIEKKDKLILLNFPIKSPVPCSLPLLEQGLGVAPMEVYEFKTERCLAVYDSEEVVKQLKPDMTILKKLAHRGVTVTAPSTTVDFVSRTFYPQKAQAEDPATGASHCLMVPYWAKRLGKTELNAKQVSPRGGEMFCQLRDDTVVIGGQAALYMQGICFIDAKRQLVTAG